MTYRTSNSVLPPSSRFELCFPPFADQSISREDLEAFIHSKYVLRNFVEGGSGKIEPMPGRKGETRSTNNIGMVSNNMFAMSANFVRKLTVPSGTA
eukprot:SAG31_NODE_1576_length_7838_cov_5.738468_5_plen_96_part_00